MDRLHPRRRRQIAGAVLACLLGLTSACAPNAASVPTVTSAKPSMTPSTMDSVAPTQAPTASPTAMAASASPKASPSTSPSASATANPNCPGGTQGTTAQGEYKGLSEPANWDTLYTTQAAVDAAITKYADNARGGDATASATWTALKSCYADVIAVWRKHTNRTD